jgi:hypothetical protein
MLYTVVCDSVTVAAAASTVAAFAFTSVDAIVIVPSE